MSVIVEATLPSTSFELGRILRVEGETHVTLETMVPLGGKPTPFVRIQDHGRDSFEQSVRDHPSVGDITQVSTHNGETLYALDWTPSEDSFFERIREMDAVLLGASGGANTWGIELRFPSHDALSEFRDYYVEAGISVTVNRIYNPTSPDAGPWYGLTPPQRETLIYAVEAGYYSLPRGISTKELAEEFDISDQAVTERLRRGITVLVENTLLTDETGE
ncbi:helix-turn-helix domain-containing protein [Natronomonas halophila]|uniref:helix-turn-helix domain-containing protein n=1 Tax=Natronomonas halophila TaxID=2747817 RepID=UPI0015B74FF8|nr:helix-turn-helix domain-containing protein [Natronomonas halophila]QLD87149.1 helix-turn-helix domain-containing protein [Natronomonas halophila]